MLHFLGKPPFLSVENYERCTKVEWAFSTEEDSGDILVCQTAMTLMILARVSTIWIIHLKRTY